MKSMEIEKLIENALQKIVVPRYPELNSVQVRKRPFNTMESYRALYHLNKKITYEMADDIKSDTEAIFSMFSLENNSEFMTWMDPDIMVHFSYEDKFGDKTTKNVFDK